MNNDPTIAVDDPLAQELSDTLYQLIVAEIRKQGGWLSFADYMQHCLYQPGLGYYSAGSHKLGESGDFTTAPETSPLFGAALARQLADVGSQIAHYEILEFGAGSGQLALAMMQQLADDDALPARYLILEPSADLRERQQRLVARQHSEWQDRISWVDDIPAHFSGVVLANEVCDAMPVHRLQFSADGIAEQGVGLENGAFCWQNKALKSPRLQAKAAQIAANIDSAPYLTEVSLAASDWLQTIAASLKQGAVFIIDYGYAFSEYYRPERAQGTLRCYFRQQAGDNPLILPGLQDITAHVDFTSLAESADEAGLSVSGFQEQTDFLLAGDITLLAEAMAHNSNTLDWIQHSSALKQLMLPGAMGHQFKVLSLTKDLDLLPRLQPGDRRYQL
jgi:SAM-dependent MidA family methyltransferase